MASIFIITPRASPGIVASHAMLSRQISKYFEGVKNETNIKFFFKYLFKFKIIIFPVHYWYLGILCRLFGKKVIFICHGRPTKSHYANIRFFILVALIKLSELISNFSIYVSNSTRGKSPGYVIHNIEKNYFFHINNFSPNTIFFFGRVDPSKGIREIFNLVDCLNISDIKYSLKIAGRITDKFLPEFMKLMENHSFATYLGEYKNHEELKSIFKNHAGFFLSLNFNEPFGIVYLEALKLGLIPIVPSGSGFLEVCEGLPIANCLLEVKKIIINANKNKKPYSININLSDDRVEFLKNISFLLCK